MHILRLQFHELAEDTAGIVVAFLIEIHLAHEPQHVRQFRVNLHRQPEGRFKFIKAIRFITGHRQPRVGHRTARLQLD